MKVDWNELTLQEKKAGMSYMLWFCQWRFLVHERYMSRCAGETPDGNTTRDLFLGLRAVQSRHKLASRQYTDKP